MNIIFGIIIDTFAELRGRKNDKDYNKKNVCYICNYDRHKFENTNDGFDVHVERDHNVWNYVFFLYNIKKKDSTEYNGMETYVSEMIENDDVNWFPRKMAMTLKSTDEDKDVIDNKIENMIERVLGINDKLNET